MGKRLESRVLSDERVIKASSAFVCLRVRTCNASVLGIPTGGMGFCTGVVALYSPDGTLKKQFRKPSVEGLLKEMGVLSWRERIF